MPQPINRIETNGTITWQEDAASGRGYYVLAFEDGCREEVQYDEPITASTDSHFVANLFEGYEFTSVDHDREYIHLVAAH